LDDSIAQAAVPVPRLVSRPLHSPLVLEGNSMNHSRLPRSVIAAATLAASSVAFAYPQLRASTPTDKAPIDSVSRIDGWTAGSADAHPMTGTINFQVK